MRKVCRHYSSWLVVNISYLLNNICFCTQGGHFSGIYRKVQLKPLNWVKIAKNNEGEEECPIEALMVLKYGGVLTHAGRKQVSITIPLSRTSQFHLNFYIFWHCLQNCDSGEPLINFFLIRFSCFKD